MIIVLTDVLNRVQVIKETIDVLEVAAMEIVEMGSYWGFRIKVIKDL